MKMVKKLFVLAIILRGLAPLAADAQPLNASRPEYIIQVADEKMEAKDYYNALDFYDKYYVATQDRSVLFKIGLANMMLKDYGKAETNFQRSLQRTKNSTGEDNPEARFYLGLMQKANEKYDESVVSFEDYIKATTDEKLKARATKELEGAKLAMRMKENPKLLLESVGNKVNTPNSEYSPSVSGGSLYFGALRDGKITIIDGKEGDYFAKIYKADRKADGSFDAPTALNNEINRLASHQGNVSFSPDGNIMYFTRFALTGNEIGESKIYYASKNGGDFGAAKEVTGVNGNWIAKHPAIGELYGKPVMFFTSNAEGTKGGFDIWYAEKIDDGAFGAPINLGAVINTEGEEATPFYQNGKLYFSSNGHTNIGGLDIFSSNWNGATWSKPENMGKGYNSAANDSYFTLDADGNAYFTSNRVGGKSLKSKTCCDDIYTVKKPPVIIDVIADVTDGKQALKGINYQLIDMTSGRKGATDAKTADKYTSTLALKRAYMIIASKAGYYSDSVQINTLDILETTTIKKTLTMRPLPVITVALRAKAQSGGADLKGVTFTLMEIGGRSDSRTLDAYGAALNREKSYMLIAGKAGYTPDTAKFDTKGIAATTEIEKVLNLKPRIITVKRNEAIKLNNIFYKLDKFEASEAHMENFVEAQQSLDYLYNIMVKYPEMVIELSSHTDSRGSDAYNMTLSQKRADGAKAYLLTKGVAEKRVVAKGYGETQLVNRCANGVKCSDEEHLQNRRTEFKIISGPTTIEIIEQQPAVKN